MAGAEVLLSSPADVKALVPDFIFKRAKEVVSSSKLHDVSFQGPSLEHSSATCAGSNPGDNYSLSILINTESSSNPTCQCSCPAAPKAKGNLCKHVVALLLLRSKELAKVAKDQANAAVLSEFKLAEDQLFEGRQISPVINNKQRRVLPSWISEGYCAPKKDVKETKVARKAGGKKDAVINEEGRACTVVGGNEISQIEQGKGKSMVLKEGGTTKSVVRKRKDTKGERVQDTGFEAEETPGVEQKTSSRAARGNTHKIATTSVKNGSLPGQKRRRRGAYVESDLSEEENPAVLDDECSFEAKKDLALTTEDLVNLATEVGHTCDYIVIYAWSRI
ncbi:hypothetical protein GOP47_0022082 [Adiantum capillus-veneris]|uniref:SWIM-type domain-containing protein n=1 Tax=Adiantum capillus-veneris TaxID=13818 RepID=A0A9D4Z767_ADICA|nr:hypothetical protein GOP47_0022082 [Adiantum capillus-veneris]